jgi:hypothetical protein
MGLKSYIRRPAPLPFLIFPLPLFSFQSGHKHEKLANLGKHFTAVAEKTRLSIETD